MRTIAYALALALGVAFATSAFAGEEHNESFEHGAKTP